MTAFILLPLGEIRLYSLLKQDMNKEVWKVKLISKNVLESMVYYSKFNPL